MKKPHYLTYSNVPSDTIDVYVDRVSSIVMQIRVNNVTAPTSCNYAGSFFSCPFLYKNDTKSQLQITYVVREGRHAPDISPLRIVESLPTILPTI